MMMSISSPASTQPAWVESTGPRRQGPHCFFRRKSINLARSASVITQASRDPQSRTVDGRSRPRISAASDLRWSYRNVSRIAELSADGLVGVIYRQNLGMSLQEMSDVELVRQVTSNAGAAGAGAHAELTRRSIEMTVRNTEALNLLRTETADSSTRMERFTKALVRLTVGLVFLTVVIAVLTAVLVIRDV
jgi:hypothetical protein